MPLPSPSAAARPTSVRGAFVFEQALTTDSPFSQEIRGLAAAGTPRRPGGSWTATVLWSPRPRPRAGSTRRPTHACARSAEGLHEVGDNLVVSADVPVVGWHVVFTQNRSEFVEAHWQGHCSSAGLILVLLLLAVGLTLTVVLARRLRQSREQAARLRELNRPRTSSSPSSPTSSARRCPGCSVSCRRASTTGRS